MKSNEITLPMNRCKVLHSLLIFFIVLSTPSALYAQGSRLQPEEPQLFKYVKGIEGRTHAGRKQFIEDELKSFHVNFRLVPAEKKLSKKDAKNGIRVENIVVRLGSGRKNIVVGAHYDAVSGSPGANDNGSGVAVVLEMIRSLKDYRFRHAVEFCFFDKEEDGLIGSAVYVREMDTSSPSLAMINLDVEGTGDEIYVGPVGGGDDDLIMKYIRAARDSTKFPYEENEVYPGSDYESFADAKQENISISVVRQGDVAKLVKWTKSGFKKIDNPADMPEVLKVMHTSDDKSLYVTEEALRLSYIFTKTTLLLLDKGEQ